MKVSIPCAAALALFPLVSAFPAPIAAPNNLDIKYGRDVLEAREMRPRQGPVTPSLPQESTTAKSTSASSSSAPSSAPPSSSSSSTSPSSSPSRTEPPSTSPSSSTTPPPPSSPTSVSQIVRTSASKTQIESTQENGQVTLVTSEIIVSITDTPTPTPPSNPPSQDNNGGSGISSSTIIGLSVAGGLAALAAVAFIAWKLTRKRFSQFDTDDGVINWPDLQKDPEVVPPRPAPSVSAGTTSTVDLVKDPYAVPPLPQNNGGLGPYRDDASGFYDPYRGPVPQAFSTPPTSTDGHQQGWVGGEAIPMSTYGRTSPGPNLAYGGGIVDPMQRTGTPVQRMATPVQRMATPVGGAATFHEIVRSGTPGAAPYRTGTPGYGYGGR